MPDTRLRSEDGAGWVLPEERAGLAVLIVEDDEADAYLVERVLVGHRRVGQIMRATNGVEALQLVDGGWIEPDLAIIDLHMPRMNGWSLLVDLGVRARTFPTIVLTSSAARSDAMRSKLRGATQVLTKPDSMEEFEALLTRAIDEL